MKLLLFLVFSLISFSIWSKNPQQMTCVDAEFGAGHFKLVVVNLAGFNQGHLPRDQRPVVSGEFWIKGTAYPGLFESAIFMPDYGPQAGWYKSTPSPFEFSLCNWKKCPVRKIKLLVHTRDQLKGDGAVKFLYQPNASERKEHQIKLSCEFR